MPSYADIVPSSNNRFVELSVGGPYDVYVQGVFTQNFEGILSLSLGDVSSKIAGIIKLSQEFLITFLTSPGTDMFEPSKGTAFAGLIGGNYYDPTEVRIVTTESVKTAEKYIKRQQSRFRPAKLSETLAFAELSRIDQLTEDAIEPYILIRSVAGQFVDVELPSINVYS